MTPRCTIRLQHVGKPPPDLGRQGESIPVDECQYLRVMRSFDGVPALRSPVLVYRRKQLRQLPRRQRLPTVFRLWFVRVAFRVGGNHEVPALIDEMELYCRT